MISRIEVSGVHYELTDDLKKYVTRKIGRLDRLVPRHARKSLHVEITLSELKTKSDRNQCEVIFHLPERQITAKESTINMFAAIDIVETKLKSQLKKYKDSHGGKHSDHRGVLRRFRRSQRET